MVFEPLGYGDRWHDRLHSGVMKPKHLAILLAIIIVLIVVWELS